MNRQDRNLEFPATRPEDGGYADGVSAVGDRLLARIEELRYRAARMTDHIVVGPNGQNLTVAEARARAEAIDSQIEMDQVRGSLMHRRVNLTTRLVTLLIVGFVDLPIMVWLASSVFNVDWMHPVGLPLVISLVVSVLATGGAASALQHIGHALRPHKNDRRQLAWAELTVGTKLTLCAVGVLTGLMGVVMFVRVETEGVLSGLNELATLLAVLVSVVLVISAWLIFWTAFRDGSIRQDDLRHYSDIIRPHLADRRRCEDQIQELACQYDLLRRSSERNRVAGS
jgi:hypothetical protein